MKVAFFDTRYQLMAGYPALTSHGHSAHRLLVMMTHKTFSSYAPVVPSSSKT